MRGNPARPLEALAKPRRREMARGRGGRKVWPYPVDLEPPFIRFDRQGASAASDTTSGPPPRAAERASSHRVVAVRVSGEDKHAAGLAQQLILGLRSTRPVSFEIGAKDGRLRFQFVAASKEADQVIHQVRTHYPHAELVDCPDLLRETRESSLIARSYRLRESHFLPLRSDVRRDTFLGMAGVLLGMQEHEFGLLQVMFQGVRNPWDQNILAVASDPWDPTQSAFVDLPDLPRLARSKVEQPLLAVGLRLVASSEALLDRIEEAFLPQFQDASNGFALASRSYPIDAVIGRFTKTPGVILNAAELVSLVHLPNPAEMPKEALEWARRTAPAPAVAQGPMKIGVNRHRGAETDVGLTREGLTHHVFVQGFTGSGKSTLLKTLMSEVMEAGYGLAFLDYAGDTADEILDLVPPHRANDVIYMNPSDREHPPAFNVLATDEREQELLAGEVMVAIKRLFAGRAEFGPRMEWILRQTVRALIASSGEKTLRDVPRFLTDSGYREEVVATVRDADVRSFWESRRPFAPSVIDPILNRLSVFLDRPTIRNMMAQPNLIDLREAMEQDKIIVCNLSKGLLGEESAYVLGSFILSKLQLAAMARAEMPASERSPFAIVIDELANLGGVGGETASIRSLISEARKFGVAWIGATQYLAQLDRELVATIFGNVGTLVCLRSGVEDAAILQRELGDFTAEDLLNLETGQAIVRMGKASTAFNVGISRPVTPSQSARDRIVRQTRERYCRSRTVVEHLLWQDVRQGREEPQKTKSDVASPLETTTSDMRPQEQQGDSPSAPSVQTVPDTTPVDSELTGYLQHIAQSPFTPALERDSALSLSRYKGDQLRKRLIASEWVRPHKASTGKRSGQLLFLEVTAPGYELLKTLKLPVTKPRGRGGFLHRYYAHKIKEYAEVAWPGSVATIEDSSEGRPVDVLVRMPDSNNGNSERLIAFEVFMTGEAKEVFGITKDVELFDQVIVCAADLSSLERLWQRTEQVLTPDQLEKVSFRPVSEFLVPPAADASPHQVPTHLPRLKSRTESDAETEPKPNSRTRPGRKSKPPLLTQIEEAFASIHDWDRLTESPLINRPEIQVRVKTNHAMPEARALHDSLESAARLVIEETRRVPSQSDLGRFLELYLEGNTVAEIARRLGVSREWCSRYHRKEAIRLTALRFAGMLADQKLNSSAEK